MTKVDRLLAGVVLLGAALVGLDVVGLLDWPFIWVTAPLWIAASVKIADLVDNFISRLR